MATNVSEESLYKKLHISREEMEELNLDHGMEPKKVVKNLLASGNTTNAEKLIRDGAYATVFLSAASKYKHFNKKKNKKKVLTCKEKKNLHLFKLNNEEQKYSTAKLIHKLWKSYIKDLLNLNDNQRLDNSRLQNIQTTLCKADMHGARLKVTKSPCNTHIGICGIVIMEKKNHFHIVTKEDKVKVIPKKHVQFTCKIEQLLVTIFGSQFCYRASERATKRFKSNVVIDFTDDALINMAVIKKLKSGWLVDHKDFINNSYTNETFVDKRSREYKIVFNEDLFRIDGEFLMDSEFTARNNQKLSTIRKRKRKAIADVNNFKELVIIDSFLKELEESKDCQTYFENLPKSILKDNNKLARNLSTDLTKRLSELSLPNKLIQDRPNDNNELILEEQTFFIPRGSKYVLGDVLDGFDIKEKYNLIVMDPPWSNKSAKRLKCYNQLTSDAILNIDIESMSEDNCFLIVWTTERWHSWVIDELLPKNGFKHSASWLWLKVTNAGKPVRPLNDIQNKAYEWLVIGRRGFEEIKIDDCNVICSVPCALHSSKPPIYQLFTDYIETELNTLEVFARNLNMNCTSWGNQVLNFQHELLYKKNFL
ncbi:DgyrCDS3879 [Dimorphilus gyrociliatus]|uniref:Ribonuclease P protein subunit p29 n=1 Tax=Dimorphilus gyrociliatus TaxID=2664684 RepID=A0A7I8VGQ9_9ANNE|nr:DgyrCDS3879 [Dimorphilus gyrociliatus]